MFTKISKEEFSNQVIERHVLAAVNEWEEMLPDDVLANMEYNIHVGYKFGACVVKTRRCAEKHATYLKFTDGSHLYLDPHTEYYQGEHLRNNWLVVHKQQYSLEYGDMHTWMYYLLMY